MKDKEQIKYYKENNILKGPDEFDNFNSRKPSKNVHFVEKNKIDIMKRILEI